MQNYSVLNKSVQTMIHKIILSVPAAQFDPNKQGMIPLSFLTFETSSSIDIDAFMQEFFAQLLYSGGNLKVSRFGESWFVEDLYGNRHLCPTEKFLTETESHRISIDDFRRCLFFYLGNHLESEWIPQLLH